MYVDRVVLDANFFISIIINGKLAQFSNLIIDNNIEVFLCDELLYEIQHVLSRSKFKNKFTKTEIRKNIDYIKLITTKQNIDERFDRAPDPKDNYLLYLCYAVKSYYLITGDKPLLNLKHVNKIQIITLSKFYKLVKEQTPDL